MVTRGGGCCPARVNPACSPMPSNTRSTARVHSRKQVVVPVERRAARVHGAYRTVADPKLSAADSGSAEAGRRRASGRGGRRKCRCMAGAGKLHPPTSVHDTAAPRPPFPQLPPQAGSSSRAVVHRPLVAHKHVQAALEEACTCDEGDSRQSRAAGWLLGAQCVLHTHPHPHTHTCAMALKKHLSFCHGVPRLAFVAGARRRGRAVGAQQPVHATAPAAMLREVACGGKGELGQHEMWGARPRHEISPTITHCPLVPPPHTPRPPHTPPHRPPPAPRTHLPPAHPGSPAPCRRTRRGCPRWRPAQGTYCKGQTVAAARGGRVSGVRDRPQGRHQGRTVGSKGRRSAHEGATETARREPPTGAGATETLSH